MNMKYSREIFIITIYYCLDPRIPYIGHQMIAPFPQNMNPMYVSLPNGYLPRPVFTPVRQHTSQSPCTILVDQNTTTQHIPPQDVNNNIPATIQDHTTSDGSQVIDDNPSLSFQSETLPPPDLLMNSFEFKRAMRRYSSAKAKDDDFFEEETKFLKGLHQKRLR